MIRLQPQAERLQKDIQDLREELEIRQRESQEEIRRLHQAAAQINQLNSQVQRAEKEQEILTVERYDAEEGAVASQQSEIQAAEAQRVLADHLAEVREAAEQVWCRCRRHSVLSPGWMKLISEIFHDHCHGDGTMTPATLRELLKSLSEQNIGLWDATDVDNILESWADKSSIDFDDFLSWVYDGSAMLSPRDVEPLSEPRHLTINFDVLAETSWGRVEGDRWIIESTKPSSFRPESEGEELVSYAEFLEQQMPGSDRRKERQKYKGAFTSPGSAGESCDGWCAVQDLELVAHELNSFCEGNHPLFPGFRMDGSDGEPDYRFDITHPERFGNFHIDAGREQEELYLVLGTIEQPGEGRFKDRCDGQKPLLLREAPAARKAHHFRHVGRCGLHLGAFIPEGGKFFLFDASKNTKRHEIFFDDNLALQTVDARRSHTVPTAGNLRARRMRQRRSWWGLPLLRTHVCRADALTAINDDLYFVAEVQRLEANYATKLAAMQRCSTCLLRLPMQKKSTLSLKYDAWESLRRDEKVLPATSESDADFLSPVSATQDNLKFI
eukprot:s621_g16.t1